MLFMATLSHALAVEGQMCSATCSLLTQNWSIEKIFKSSSRPGYVYTKPAFCCIEPKATTASVKQSLKEILVQKAAARLHLPRVMQVPMGLFQALLSWAGFQHRVPSGTQEHIKSLLHLFNYADQRRFLSPRDRTVKIRLWELWH